MSPRTVERVALAGTSLFVVATLGAAATASLATAAVLLDLVLFLLGCVAFASTLVRAAGRSRDEVLTVAGIWFLTGSAPARPRRLLLCAFGVQVLLALSTPMARPELAFGALVPVFGLGCSGLWAVRAGTFPARLADRAGPRR